MKHAKGLGGVQGAAPFKGEGQEEGGEGATEEVTADVGRTARDLPRSGA